MKKYLIQAGLPLLLLFSLLCANNAHAAVKKALSCDFNADIYYPDMTGMNALECDSGLTQCHADLGPIPCEGVKRCIWKVNNYKCINGWDRCMSVLPQVTPEERAEAEAYHPDKCLRLNCTGCPE